MFHYSFFPEKLPVLSIKGVLSGIPNDQKLAHPVQLDSSRVMCICTPEFDLKAKLSESLRAFE